MRFCLVSTQTTWGGGEALAWSVAQELQRTGHDVTWVARADGALAARIRQQRATAVYLRQRKGRSPSDVIATVRAIRAWSPDVIIANDTHAVPLMGAACWFSGTSVPLRLAYKHTVFPIRSRLKYLLCSDIVVGVSAAVTHVIEHARVPASRTAMIYGACDVPATCHPDRASVFQEFALPESATLLVAVGSLLECKGHIDLIQAVAELQTTHANVHLLIAGEGPERERLAAHIASCGLTERVRLAGFRDDACRLLASADLVVHPSHTEGLSLVLIQAQLLRKPIVATAVGGAAEVLNANDPHACTAWLAEPGNAADLAHQIQRALDHTAAPSPTFDERLTLSATRMRDTFSVHSATQQLVQLVQSRRHAGER
jgi:L-malate glycosyltransferase